MKIIFFGNICNFSYWYAKWGQELGYDTSALIEQGESVFKRDRPEWEDDNYDPNNPPSWLSFYRIDRKYQILTLPKKNTDEIFNILKTADSIHTFSYTSAIIASRLGFKFIHHTVGSFSRSAEYFKNIDYKTMLKPQHYILVYFFRKALSDSKAIIVSTPIEYNEVNDSIFSNKIKSLPLAYETKLNGKKNTIRKLTKILFFMPARQHWEFKGQDMVLLALKNLSNKGFDNFKIKLLMWGKDKEKTISLINKLSLSKLVLYGEILTKKELYNEFKKEDLIVIDQFPKLDFKGGGIGGTARDALTIGVPVFTHARPVAQELIFSTSPPVIHSECKIKDIEYELEKILKFEYDLNILSKKSIAWMSLECDFRIIIPKVIRFHEENIS